jgi:thiosulfate reductase cytochrome b subunit
MTRCRTVTATGLRLLTKDGSVEPKARHVILHSRCRYTHWTWTLGVMILIGSGWRIYNQGATVRLPALPGLAHLDGEYADAERVHNDFGLAAALLWHFAAMWLLFFSITVYTIYGILANSAVALAASAQIMGRRPNFTPLSSSTGAVGRGGPGFTGSPSV